MQYIIAMSFAGSTLFIASLLLSGGKKRRLPDSITDVLFRFSMLYYVVPLFFLEGIYREALCCLPFEPKHAADGVYDMVYIKNIADGKVRVNSAYRAQLAAVLIWICITAGILFVRICRYIAQRKKLLAQARQITDSEVWGLLENVRREYGIRRRIFLYGSNQEALTMGVIRPVIFLDDRMPKDRIEMILRHECMHIKRLDVLTGQLAAFAVCLHWCNPLVYLLRRKMEWISEICCDERTVRDAGKEKRALYAKALLENMQETQMPSFAYRALTRQGKLAEERIMLIMKPQKRTKKKKMLAGALAGAMIFLNSLTVLAYPKVTTVRVQEGTEQDGYSFYPDGEMYFIEDGAENPFIKRYEILYDRQFIDEEGNIYPIEEGVSTAAVHTHRWVSGTITVHNKTADGGCVIYEYASQRCLRCGIVEQGELINTLISTKCNH